MSQEKDILHCLNKWHLDILYCHFKLAFLEVNVRAPLTIIGEVPCSLSQANGACWLSKEMGLGSWHKERVYGSHGKLVLLVS